MQKALRLEARLKDCWLSLYGFQAAIAERVQRDYSQKIGAFLLLVPLSNLFLRRRIDEANEPKTAHPPLVSAPSPGLTEPAADEPTFADFDPNERERLLQQIRDQQQTITLLEQKLRTHYQILDQLPVGVFAKDAEGRHLLANRALAQRIGVETQDIVNRRDDDLPDPARAGIYRAEDNQILTGTRKTVRNEVNVATAQGKNRVLRSQKWPLRDEHGDIVGVIGISEDITDERQQEDSLAISRQQIALLFEHSPLAIVEWDLDGDITNWNPAAERMFGVPNGTALGRPLAELVLVREARDYAENLRQLFRRDRALVALGSLPLDALRTEHRDADGQTVAREWTFTILRQTQGVVVGFGAMITDVTAQARAQARLEQTLERLDSFVEQVPVAIIEWDAQRIIQRWNPAAEAIFGWAASEAVGKEALDLLVPSAQQAHVSQVFTRLINGSAPVFSENENLHRDGTQIICQWINIPLMNELGERIGLISVAQDVTDRRRSQQQEIQLTANHARMVMLRQFVQRISHYFRNHLAQVEVNRYLMQRAVGMKDGAHLTERFALLRESVQRMAEQLDNLTMLSSIAVIEEERTDLTTVAQSAYNHFLRQASGKAMHYTFVPADESLQVMVDPKALRDALRRLLHNAISYTPPEGTVIMRLGRDGEDALIAIEDNGIGMTDEQADKAFELFYRVDDASSLETGGLGLGLNIARMIVETHHGTIAVRSSLGKGSTFIVRLPLA